MSADYRILDEPRPGALEQLAVRPMWPLLAMMLAGGWLAWPWFVVNSFAVGSPTRSRELGIVALSIGGTAALAILLLWLDRAGVIDSSLQVRIAVLVILGWKLGTAYAIDLLQDRTFDVYEHYGGVLRNGLYVLLAGFFLRPYVADLFDSLLWKIIISGGVLG